MHNARKRKQFEGNAVNLLCTYVCSYIRVYQFNFECRRICIYGATYKILNLNVNVNRHVWHYIQIILQKFIIQTSLTYQGPNTSQHKNKNVKNVISPFYTFPIYRQATNETHITHCECITKNATLLLLLLLLLLLQLLVSRVRMCISMHSCCFMHCILYIFKVLSGKFETNATSEETNFSICVVGKHTKTIKWHITS